MKTLFTAPTAVRAIKKEDPYGKHRARYDLSMEEVIASHPDVAECAVVGVHDELKGQVPLGFVVLKAGADRDHSQLQAELVQMVRDQIGPVAVFKQTKVVARLPKTRSGKILRATMRRIADGREYTRPANNRRPRHPRRDHPDAGGQFVSGGH